MLIYQIPVRNPLRNYMYLLVCEKTNEALAIDPLDHALCLKRAADLGVTITIVANTHHHHDHIGGNKYVIKATNAKLVAHSQAVEHIPNVEVGLNAGDSLKFGLCELTVMDTPGHTMSHICLYYPGDGQIGKALFCGDTLFNAGVGRCDFGGEPEVLYRTFKRQIFLLDDDVSVYPGHDYIENNLNFTLHIEPNNKKAKKLLQQFDDGLDTENYVTTIGLEREINTFFRLKNKDIRKILHTNDDKSTFVALRKERDSW